MISAPSPVRAAAISRARGPAFPASSFTGTTTESETGIWRVWPFRLVRRWHSPRRAPGLIQGRGPCQQPEGFAIAQPAKSARFFEAAAKRPFAALFVLCALLWLPGLFSLPPLDRDESRFAQSS